MRRQKTADRRQKRLRVCSSVYCLLTAVFFSYAGEEYFNAPAVKVNTQIVSVREVEVLYRDSFIVIQERLDKGELKRENLEAEIRKAWTEALETAAQDRLIDQRADARRNEIVRMYLGRAGASGYSGDRALDMFRRLESDAIRRLRKHQITAAGGEEELRKALKRRGQTMKDWEAGLSREIFRQDVLALEMGLITPSPSAAKKYYDAHPEKFGDTEAWRLRRIRIAKAKFSTPEVALEAAKLAKKKLGEGGDFSEIAASVSEDAEFAGQGGLLTKDGKTDLPPNTFPVEEKVASELKDGGVSDPIDAGNWWVLVKRDGYRAASVQKFEEAEPRAEALAFNEKLKQRKRDLFEKLKRNAYIEFIQKDPPPQVLKAAAIP